MAEKLIYGFLFHIVGDYIIQNDWMANQKTKIHMLRSYMQHYIV